MKKFFAKHSTVIMILMLILSALIGSTAATYTHNTEKRNNPFLFGNVDIQLMEEQWDQWNKSSPDEKILFPGKTVSKDPKVKNTGECSAYIFLKITVPKREKIKVVEVVDSKEKVISMPQNESDNRNGVELFTYEIKKDHWQSVAHNYDNTDYNEYIFGYGSNKYGTIVSPGEETEKLFEKVTFLNIVEGAIEQGTKLNIGVEAMAVQSDYLKLDEGATLTEIYNNTIKETATQQSEGD